MRKAKAHWKGRSRATRNTSSNMSIAKGRLEKNVGLLVNEVGDW